MARHPLFNDLLNKKFFSVINDGTSNCILILVEGHSSPVKVYNYRAKALMCYHLTKGSEFKFRIIRRKEKKCFDIFFLTVSVDFCLPISFFIWILVNFKAVFTTHLILTFKQNGHYISKPKRPGET